MSIHMENAFVQNLKITWFLECRHCIFTLDRPRIALCAGESSTERRKIKVPRMARAINNYLQTKGKNQLSPYLQRT